MQAHAPKFVYYTHSDISKHALTHTITHTHSHSSKYTHIYTLTASGNIGKYTLFLQFSQVFKSMGKVDI